MKRKLFTRCGPASVVLVLSALAISACSDTRHLTFACEDGREGSVTWRADQTALVSFHGDSWFLHQQPSGSGARYGDGKHEIWEHQGSLTVKTGTTTDAVCHYPEDKWF